MLAYSSQCIEATEGHNLSPKHGDCFISATVMAMYLFKHRLKENTHKHNPKVTYMKGMLINADQLR